MIGAVPETNTSRPTTIARENPTVGSYGEPEEMRFLVTAGPRRAEGRGGKRGTRRRHLRAPRPTPGRRATRRTEPPASARCRPPASATPRPRADGRARRRRVEAPPGFRERRPPPR